MQRINDMDEACYILNLFQDTLPRLKEVDIEKLAKKIIDKGNLYVIRDGILIAGTVAFYCNNLESKEAYLSLIGVKEPYRKKGYGKRLLQLVLSESTRAGMKSVRLEVRSDNKEAIRFYMSKGFYAVGRAGNDSVYMIRRPAMKSQE